MLEQQPGPVNWARHNPAPAPGMVRLWTLEAAAHGAELVSYFRWRQNARAQELMHAGMLRTDGEPAPALGEARAAADDLMRLDDIGRPLKQAALIFDYTSEWVTQIQPHGEGKSALWAAFATYSALRKLGLNVDIEAPGAPLDSHLLVVALCLPVVPEALAHALERFSGQIVLGPRTGSRTQEFAIPDTLPPGPLTRLAGGHVVRSESLRPGLDHVGDGWAITGWLDQFQPLAQSGAIAELTAEDGAVACWRRENVRTCTGWPEGSLIERVMENAARDAGLPIEKLTAGKRVRRTDRYTFRADYLNQHIEWEPTE